MKKKLWFWLSLAILLDLVVVVVFGFMIYHIVLLDLPWFTKLVLPAVGMVSYSYISSIKEHLKFYKDCFSGSLDPENK